MEAIVVLLVAAAALGAVAATVVGSKRLAERRAADRAEGWNRALRAVAKTHHLTEMPRPNTPLLSVSGELDGLPVAITASREPPPEQGSLNFVTLRDHQPDAAGLCLVTWLNVDIGLPKTLRMHAEDLLGAMARLMAGEDYGIGNLAFDRANTVDGLPPATLTAICSGRARVALTRWLKLGGIIADGALRYPLGATDETTVIDKALKNARALATHLTPMRPTDPLWVQQRLSDAALSDDPDVSFRVVAATRLFNAFPDAAITQTTADRLLDSNVPTLQAAAAGASDAPRAIDVAYAVAIDTRAPDGARHTCFGVLMTRSPCGPQLQSAVEQLLQTPASPLAFMALHAASQLPPQPIAALLPLVSIDDIRDVAIAELARHSPDLQPDLVRRLSLAATDDEMLQLAHALRATADIGAIEPLRTASGGASRHVRRALDAAIAKIQSRAPAAGAGQLSVTTASGGQLSEPSDHANRRKQ